MDDAAVKISMKPSHPGEFIREEILNELGLSVACAASCNVSTGCSRGESEVCGVCEAPQAQETHP